MAARPFIVMGDGTDHGGTVVECSVMTDTHGKGIARVGDQVTCPIPGHGTTVIVSGDPTMIIDGKPAARHGDKCACGATLISSQIVSTVGGGGGGSGGVSSTSAAPAAEPPTNKAAPAQSAAAPVEAAARETFDQQFLLLDQETGVPLIEQPYTIHYGGRKIPGVTDENGYTQRISTGNEVGQLEIEVHGEVCHG